MKQILFCGNVLQRFFYCNVIWGRRNKNTEDRRGRREDLQRRKDMQQMAQK